MSLSATTQEPEAMNSTLEQLQSATNKLDLPQYILDSSLEIYMQSYKNNLYNGRSIESILGATIYISCRENDIARRPNQIADCVGCTERELMNTVQHFKDRLNISLKPSTPSSYTTEFLSKLEVNPKTYDTALEIADMSFDSSVFSGRSAAGLAAGAIYAASTLTGEKINQSDIQDVSGVSTVTIRKNYPEQREMYVN